MELIEELGAIETAVTDLLVVTGQLARRLRAVSNRRKLSWTQVAIMARLGDEGPATIAELARAEAVKPQSMGVTMGILENEGFVERSRDPADARQILFGLTEQGQEARKEVRLDQRDWLLACVGKLSLADRQALTAAVDLLRRLDDM